MYFCAILTKACWLLPSLRVDAAAANRIQREESTGSVLTDKRNTCVLRNQSAFPHAGAAEHACIKSLPAPATPHGWMSLTAIGKQG